MFAAGAGPMLLTGADPVLPAGAGPVLLAGTDPMLLADVGLVLPPCSRLVLAWWPQVLQCVQTYLEPAGWGDGCGS